MVFLAKESEMSKRFCTAVFDSPKLSDSAARAVSALDTSGWSSLWSLILQYGAPIVVQAVEAVVPALPIGAGAKVIIAAVVAEIAKLLPSDLSEE
jgi:hypothetical protein